MPRLTSFLASPTLARVPIRVGIDLVAVSGVQAALEAAHGEHYLERVYTVGELEDCRTPAGVDPERLAARFAAKEATLKVLPIGDEGFALTAIEVRRRPRVASTCSSADVPRNSRPTLASPSSRSASPMRADSPLPSSLPSCATAKTVDDAASEALHTSGRMPGGSAASSWERAAILPDPGSNVTRATGLRQLRHRRAGTRHYAARRQAREIHDQVRQIITDHGRLPVDASALDDHADLYQAGMTSHASVNVMLALEDAFDVEFPDAMLKRSVFESIASIAAALTQLEAAPA